VSGYGIRGKKEDLKKETNKIMMGKKIRRRRKEVNGEEEEYSGRENGE
jgi:hypothetical protein